VIRSPRSILAPIRFRSAATVACAFEKRIAEFAQTVDRESDYTDKFLPQMGCARASIFGSAHGFQQGFGNPFIECPQCALQCHQRHCQALDAYRSEQAQETVHRQHREIGTVEMTISTESSLCLAQLLEKVTETFVEFRQVLRSENLWQAAESAKPSLIPWLLSFMACPHLESFVVERHGGVGRYPTKGCRCSSTSGPRVLG
jgi:hypothetical protein